MAETMLATYYNKSGGPGVVKVGQIPKPQESDLQPGEILVKVLGASLNPVDYKQRNGSMPFLKLKWPVVFGFDYAGVVVAQKDTAFKEGDEVYGMVKGLRRGSLAQYLIVDGDTCSYKPNNVSMVEAAAIPLVSITAMKAYRACQMEEYKTHDSLKVLVLGGAGGVGTYAIQLARGLYGATFVATTASPGKKTELVKKLGADFVANYRDKDCVTSLEPHAPFDVLFDTVGDLKKYTTLVKDGGFMVSIATAPTAESLYEFAGGREVPSFARGFIRSSFGTVILNRLLGSTSVRKTAAKRGITYNSVLGGGKSELTDILKKETEEGRLLPVIDKEYPLEEGIQAIAHLESGHAAGKVVLGIKHED